jgi:hypothetical protein
MEETRIKILRTTKCRAPLGSRDKTPDGGSGTKPSEAESLGTIYRQSYALKWLHFSIKFNTLCTQREDERLAIG